jgi:hypothetical protein
MLGLGLGSTISTPPAAGMPGQNGWLEMQGSGGEGVCLRALGSEDGATELAERGGGGG